MINVDVQYIGAAEYTVRFSNGQHVKFDDFDTAWHCAHDNDGKLSGRGKLRPANQHWMAYARRHRMI